ncbi:MarR family winged helix-turn-helix transcriptional regulator [Georgenia wangjunii]|uniref:MarR family winged helix-turn-helix transcriptional regulator n=1 Tax=Georgenia wangjunii TaxID=3117730 RepID=UPI002F25EFC7
MADDERDASAGARHSGTRAAAEAWEELFRAQVTLMRRFERDGNFEPLATREYDVLFQLSLGTGEGMRMRELNELILLSQPSLSRMVDRLSAKGLVRRVPAPDDARGVLVALTAAGAELQQTIGRAHVRSIRRYVGGALGEDELAELGRLARKLRDAQRGL